MKKMSKIEKPKVIGSKKSLESISAILGKVEGKVLFAEKIEYAKQSLSKTKTLPI